MDIMPYFNSSNTSLWLIINCSWFQQFQFIHCDMCFAGTIFRLKGAILAMSFLDCNGLLIPCVYENWRDSGRDIEKRDKSSSSKSLNSINSKVNLLYFSLLSSVLSVGTRPPSLARSAASPGGAEWGRAWSSLPNILPYISTSILGTISHWHWEKISDIFKKKLRIIYLVI